MASLERSSRFVNPMEEQQPYTAQYCFNGAIALVTGGTRGIGKNIARALGKGGAQVIICGIVEEHGAMTQSELKQEGIEVEFLAVDLRRRGAPQEVVQQVVRSRGTIDFLVNNARSGKRIALLDEDEESWEETLSVTLRAVFFASQEAIRSMAKAGKGSIVNLSSVCSSLVSHDAPSYQVAKAGVEQMTRHLAAIGGPSGIRVNAVRPGFIVQDEHRQRYQHDENASYADVVEQCHPLRTIGSSDQIARAVLFLCSDEAQFITGQVLTVDGGLTIQEQSTLGLQLGDVLRRRMTLRE